MDGRRKLEQQWLLGEEDLLKAFLARIKKIQRVVQWSNLANL